MSDMDSTSRELRIDQAIDALIARRHAGAGAGGPLNAPRPARDEDLLTGLSRLAEAEWPADEAGDRITAAVALAVAAGQQDAGKQGRAAVSVPGQPQGPAPAPPGHGALRPGLRAGTGYLRSSRSRWIGVAAVAAAAALVAGLVQLAGGPHGAARPAAAAVPSSGPPAPAAQQPAHRGLPVARIRSSHPVTLAAMTVVGQRGNLNAIGGVSNGDSNITCVTRSVCYIVAGLGRDGHDIARSEDGGATWTSGAALPRGLFSSPPSCSTPVRCLLPFGSAMIETSDGFASFSVHPLGVAGPAQAVSCPTPSHCVAVADLTKRQGFLTSDDGGLTWAMAARSPRIGLGAVMQLRCDQRGACIAAVSAGDEEAPTVAALHSADGGRTWAISSLRAVPDWTEGAAVCGDGRNCIITAGGDWFAWLHVSAGGHVRIRVEKFPKSWPAVGVAVSCPAGRICFLETADAVGASASDATLEKTTDGGRTWQSLGTPMAPAFPHVEAAFLSCPAAAGCVAIAQNPARAQQTWIVLSNLHAAR